MTDCSSFRGAHSSPRRGSATQCDPSTHSFQPACTIARSSAISPVARRVRVSTAIAASEFLAFAATHRIQVGQRLVLTGSACPVERVPIAPHLPEPPKARAHATSTIRHCVAGRATDRLLHRPSAISGKAVPRRKTSAETVPLVACIRSPRRSKMTIVK